MRYSFRVLESPAIQRTIRQGQVDIYCHEINELENFLQDTSQLLNTEDKRRAERFYLPALRRSSTITRAATRFVLSHYLQQHPQQIDIRKTISGKPYVYNSNIHFSITHSHSHFAIAIANMPVGIDIEPYDASVDIVGIAEKFFTAKEQLALNGQHQQSAFYTLWTAKEAYMKCHDVGLAEAGVVDGTLDIINALESKQVIKIPNYKGHYIALALQSVK